MAPAIKISPPEDFRATFLSRKIPIAHASAVFRPTAYPSGNPSFATTLLHLPREVVMDASAPPSSKPPASQILPPLVSIEELAFR
jgi:hypothetical protein